MSKMVLICFRDRTQGDDLEVCLRVLARRLTPENIGPKDPFLKTGDGLALAVFQPCALVYTRGRSAALGHMIENGIPWHQTGRGVPEGAFAIIRTDEDVVELATDMLASRTLWYVLTPRYFLAGTSQRAIIALLGSFEPDEEAVSWMISSGTLGPGLSWDRRLRCLPPKSILRLDRRSWQTSTVTRDLPFIPEPLAEKDHEERLEAAIGKVFRKITLDPDLWVLPLSGGFDSRALLLQLQPRYPDLRCVTWGDADAVNRRSNDAAVARKLSTHLKVNHRYFPIEQSSRHSPETLLSRFLMAGEGRIDHLSAYLDGFDLWRQLHDAGIQGIIRGDECFGSRYLISHLDFRKFLFATMFSDYPEIRKKGLEVYFPQHWPVHFRQQVGETLETWRDRLYAQYYFPYVLAPLNDLKLSYVEIMNPLISQSIVQLIRRLPDRLRTEKCLFRKIVKKRSPKIPFARYPAVDLQRDFLRSGEMKTFLGDQLQSSQARSLFPRPLLNWILASLEQGRAGSFSQRHPFVQRIRPFIPPPLVKNIQRLLAPEERMDGFDTALRCCIVLSMRRLLDRDASLIAHFLKMPSQPVRNGWEELFPAFEAPGSHSGPFRKL